MRHFQHDTYGISGILSYLFSFSLATIVMVTSVFITTGVIDEKTTQVAELEAQSIANKISDGILEAMTIRETQPTRNFSKTLKIPVDLAGRSYYVEAKNSTVFVNTTDGRVSESSTTYNSLNTDIGVSSLGRVYGGSGKIRVSFTRPDYVYKLDFGTGNSTHHSPVEYGYHMVNKDSTDIPTQRDGVWTLENYQYRIPILVENDSPEYLIDVPVLVSLDPMNFEYKHANVSYNSSSVVFSDLVFHDPVPSASSQIDIDPSNWRNHWLYKDPGPNIVVDIIELSDGYTIYDIENETIKLNNQVSPEPGSIETILVSGKPRLRMRFNGQEAVESLKTDEDDIPSKWYTITISGVLIDEARFVGFGTINIGNLWLVDDNGPNDPAHNDNTISDPDEDGSANHPFDSIQEAINYPQVNHRDTIYVCAGYYNEKVPITKEINLIGDDKTTTTINGAALGVGSVINIQANNVVVDSIKVSFSGGGSAYEINGVDNVVINNCIGHFASRGILIRNGASNNLIIDTFFYYLYSDGVIISESSHNTLINTTVYDTGISSGRGDDIRITGNSHHNNITNCNLYNTTVKTMNWYKNLDRNGVRISSGAHNNTIRDTQINGYNWISADAVEINSSSAVCKHNKVINITAFNNSVGINFTGTSLGEFGYNEVINCEFYNSNYGVRSLWCHFNNITGCDIHDTKDYIGSGDFGHGIYLENSGAYTIEGCKIDNNENIGIKTKGFASHTSIIRCDIYGNGGEAIPIANSGNILIDDCNIYNNDGTAINLTDSNNTEINNCNIYFNNGTGIDLRISDNINITNCEIYGNDHAILLRNITDNGLGSNGNNISNCKIHDNNYSLFVNNSNWNNINNCTIHDNYWEAPGASNDEWGYGIYIYGSNNNTIENSSIYNHIWGGIAVSTYPHHNHTTYNWSYESPVFSENNSIVNCDIFNNSAPPKSGDPERGVGIRIMGTNTTRTTIQGCEIFDHYYGIYIFSSQTLDDVENNNITDCVIFSNRYGVHLWGDNNDPNQVYNPWGAPPSFGLHPDYDIPTTNNQVISCNLTHNRYGIYISRGPWKVCAGGCWGGVTLSTQVRNSTICLNNFYDNIIKHAFESGCCQIYNNVKNWFNSTWLMDPPLGGVDIPLGNYWDDHNPGSIDGPPPNGVYDPGEGGYLIPYTGPIGPHNADYYPLREPSELRSPSIIQVDDDRPGGWYDKFHVSTIREGITNVAENGTVIVYNGTYNEIIEANKTITLKGEDNDQTIIDTGGSNAIIVTANNVNISGFKIENNLKGILIFNVANTSVYNCKILNNDDGVYINSNSNFSHISNCDINNGDTGINIKENSHNTTILNCNIRSNTLNGIVINKLSNNTKIDNCNIILNENGIYILENTEKQYIQNSNIKRNSKDGIRIVGTISEKCKNNSIINCRLSQNEINNIYIKNGIKNNIENCTFEQLIFFLTGIEEDCIQLENTDFTNISNCTIISNSRYVFYLHDNSDSNIISNCDINPYPNPYPWITYPKTFKNGIGIENSEKNIIIDCELTGNDYGNSGTGIDINVISWENKIINCHIYNFTKGITIYDNLIESRPDPNNIIRNCDIHDMLQDGIRISNTQFNVISGCEINYNQQYGIYITASSGNVINNSEIKGNTDYGIYCGTAASSNEIYHNRFKNNHDGDPSKNAYADMSNKWNLSLVQGGGNYWSDYQSLTDGAFDYFSGPNQNSHGGDGFVDTPYDGYEYPDRPTRGISPVPDLNNNNIDFYPIGGGKDIIIRPYFIDYWNPNGESVIPVKMSVPPYKSIWLYLYYNYTGSLITAPGGMHNHTIQEVSLFFDDFNDTDMDKWDTIAGDPTQHEGNVNLEDGDAIMIKNDFYNLSSIPEPIGILFSTTTKESMHMIEAKMRINKGQSNMILLSQSSSHYNSSYIVSANNSINNDNNLSLHKSYNTGPPTYTELCNNSVPDLSHWLTMRSYVYRAITNTTPIPSEYYLNHATMINSNLYNYETLAFEGNISYTDLYYTGRIGVVDIPPGDPTGDIAEGPPLMEGRIGLGCGLLSESNENEVLVDWIRVMKTPKIPVTVTLGPIESLNYFWDSQDGTIDSTNNPESSNSFDSFNPGPVLCDYNCKDALRNFTITNLPSDTYSITITKGDRKIPRDPMSVTFQSGGVSYGTLEFSDTEAGEFETKWIIFDKINEDDLAIRFSPPTGMIPEQEWTVNEIIVEKGLKDIIID